MCKVVCAWCGKVMGHKPGRHGITHGICDKCLATEVAKVRAMLKPLTDVLGKSPGMRAVLGKEAKV